MTREEQATLNFYHWETRGRGYHLFDKIIEIEPPYIPFTPLSYHKTNNKGSSWLGRLLSTNTKQDIQETEYPDVVATYINETAELYSLEIIFPHYMERPPIVMEELLGLLSFSEELISFEIIAQRGKIHIRLVMAEGDMMRVSSHFKAFYPEVIINEVHPNDLDIYIERDVAIADFGLSEETMLPLAYSSSYGIDALTSIIAIMDTIPKDEFIMFQILFKGVTAPWAKDFKDSTSDGNGGSFFMDAPYMHSEAQKKSEDTLFAVVMRSVVQSPSRERMYYLSQEICRTISIVSESKYNKLIPLSNENYLYDDHLRNVFWRTTNRVGFILNVKELSHFVHYPSRSIVSPKLGVQGAKTKQISYEAVSQKYVLGINEHNGVREELSLSDEQKLKHIHLIGVTGVGKSTLIAQMIINDMEQGNGCALFDPHGDIVQDVLERIPEHRKDDVIIIDPSDTDFPIGFNLLHATTEAEKVVLSSDLVSAFRNQSSAWGDKMTSVLTNAVSAFLESSIGGTIIELKRFLIEDTFRTEFLESVTDPSIHYYWNNEYPMVKKGIAPLLTRIDIFLNSKIIRYMFAQKQGVDFRACIEEKKIVLIKLSQGLIGEQNSYLLGSLFLAKLNQVALGRQALAKSERHPFFTYCDEFQNYATDSIESMLSGARKYGLGLVLANQELAQISNPKILNSVISNPYTRICFRLGDSDAKRLASGFSYFEESDLQSLAIGETITRVGGASNDCNMKTHMLSEATTDNKAYIISKTRERYCKPKDEVEAILHSLLPINSKKGKASIPKETMEPIKELPKPKEEIKKVDIPILETPKTEIIELEKEKEKYLKEEEEKTTIRKHRHLQNHVKNIGTQRGYKAVIEEETNNGGRVDISLLKDKTHIAVEVSVSNTIDYEVKNIIKCIESGYTHVCMLSESLVHLKNIKKRAQRELTKENIRKLTYLTPLEFTNYLDNLSPKEIKKQKRVRGYRVKSNHIDIQSKDAKDKNEALKNIVLKSTKKGKKG